MFEHLENIAQVGPGMGFSTNNRNSIDALERILANVRHLSDEERYFYDQLYGEREELREAAKALLRMRNTLEVIERLQESMDAGPGDERMAMLARMGRELRCMSQSVLGTAEEVIRVRIMADYGL